MQSIIQIQTGSQKNMLSTIHVMTSSFPQTDAED